MFFADDEGSTLDPDKDWTEYWRILFKKVTLDDVKKFEEKFRGSQEEEEELKNAYIEAEASLPLKFVCPRLSFTLPYYHLQGDMQVIIDSVMCATMEDEDR